MKKRLLSLFLALVMLVSLIPTTAVALSDIDYGWVAITNVDVRAWANMFYVTLNPDTDYDYNLVFAGYSESGKLLVSAAHEISASHENGRIISLDCEGLSDAGSLATVKVFALGPDNRLLGQPYETQAYASNPTQDSGSWEYRRGEYLYWQYDNGTLTITSQYSGYPAIIPGEGELSEGNPYPWAKYKNRVTTLNLESIGIVGGYVFSEYRALETVNSDVYLSVDIEGFSKCPNLKTVNAKISNLAPSAFLECGSLEELALRDAQSIGQYALDGTAIRQIVLQNPDVELHGGAFQGMNNLVYVSLPAGMTEIPESLMKSLHSLQVVAGLENVTNIGAKAFKESGISTYYANPNGVRIYEEAFADCANLHTVEISGPSILADGAFSEAHITSLILNAVNIPVAAFTQGGGTEEFEEMARVELINTVSVADYAFWRRSIGDLYIPATLTNLTDDAFGNTEIAVLHLPAGWDLDTLAAMAGEQAGWEHLQDAVVILDSEGNILQDNRESDGDGSDIVMEETTEPTEVTVPETTPETTPATVPETTPETTPATEAPETTEAPVVETEAPETEAPIDPENFDTVYVAPEGASMEEVYTADDVAVFSGTDTASGDKHTVKFSGLSPESPEPYVLIVSATPGDLVNLQYIDYGYADAKGQLTMTYIPKVSGNYTVQLYGPAGDVAGISLNQDYVTLEVGQTFTLEVLNAEDCEAMFGYADENQDIVSLQPIPLGSASQTIVAKNVGITQVLVRVRQYSTGFEKELTCTVEVVAKPTVLDAHLMDTKATKELFSDTDNPRIYISLTKKNTPVISSEGDMDTYSSETTIIKDARFANEELNNYFKLRPVNDRALEIVSYLPGDLSQVKTSYVSAIEVLAGENEDYLTTPETLKLTVKKTWPKVTAKTVTINAWNPGTQVPILFDQAVRVVGYHTESMQTLKDLGIRYSNDEDGKNPVFDTSELRVDTPKQTVKVGLYAGLDGWLNLGLVNVTVKIINTPVTAKLSTSKITLSSVNSKGTDLQLVAPKGYALEDLGIRDVAVDSNDYILGGFDPSTGSFHLSPIRQAGEDYANPVAGKINIQVTYANGVTVNLPLTVTTKAPTIKPKKSSFSFLNGVMDVQGAAVTVSPADYDLSVFDPDDEDSPLATGAYLIDPENPGKIMMVASGFIVTGDDSDAKYLAGQGVDALGVTANSNGYVGSVKLTFDRIPGVKPITVTVKFTKNTPTMSLKVNGTIDASKTNKVTLTTTVKNMNERMVFGEDEDVQVALFDPQGNAVDPSEYVVDVPSPDSPNTLLLYRRPEMSGQLEDGTYTVQVTRRVYSMFGGETPIVLTASAKLKVKNTVPTLKVSKTKVTLNPYDGKDIEIKVTVPKDQYMGNKYVSSGGTDYAPIVYWDDDDTLIISSRKPNGKLNDIPDGTYDLVLYPDFRRHFESAVHVTVTVQRKALKSVKTWKDGDGINLLDWNSDYYSGFFLPMSETAAQKAKLSVTFQGSNDNKNFETIDLVAYPPKPQRYYPVAFSRYDDYFPAGKYDGFTLKEDCAYFGVNVGFNPRLPGEVYANDTYDLYRYHRFRLVVENENDEVIFEQYIKLDVKDPTLKVTQSKVPTVDRRDLTKPFTTQVKFNEKNVTLAAKIAEDAWVNENTLWSSLVRVTNLDENGNLTLAFQDAIIMSDVGKSVTIPVTFYVPYGREDQTFTANIKVNFK